MKFDILGSRSDLKSALILVQQEAWARYHDVDMSENLDVLI
jgi:hypothetical protein